MDNILKRFLRKLFRMKVYALIHFNSGKKYEIYNPELAIKIAEFCTSSNMNQKWTNLISNNDVVYLSINGSTINYIEYDYKLIEQYKIEYKTN